MGCQCDDRQINTVLFEGLALLDLGLYTLHYERGMVCFVGVTESDHASRTCMDIFFFTLAACFRQKMKALLCHLAGLAA